jgi:hypothetical protein
MNKEFVTYEQALELKELGFDEPCFAIYSGFDEDNFSISDTIRLYSSKFRINDTQSNCFYINNFNSPRVSAPTFSQAFRWFREKYPELDFAVGKIYNGTNNYHYHINLLWEYFEGTYEEAELECLKKLIEIVKNKQ